jgi:hypothetical protein
VPGTPLEGWERALAWWRRTLAGFIAERPASMARVLAARAWCLWLGALLLVALVLVSDRYRSSLAVYAACWWTLLLWWVAARTKTVSWFAVAKMFSFGVLWAGFISWVSFRLAAVAGIGVGSAGPGTAIAALTEESLKLVPIALVALVGPGRVRRFAAADWLLLGMAAGMGFQAWEDLVRRLAAKVHPSISDLVYGQGPGSGYPQYDAGLLSGGFGTWEDRGVFGYPGHHVTTALVATAVGLAVALWRAAPSRPGRAEDVVSARVSLDRRVWMRPAAVGLPLLAWFCVMVDHFGYNATGRDAGWTDDDAVARVFGGVESSQAAPWVFRVWWEHTGQGTGRGWLLLICLVPVLLVDAGRLSRAGRLTDLPRELWTASSSVDGNQGVSWLVKPHRAVERIAGGLVDRSGQDRDVVVKLVRAAVALVVFAARDLLVTVASHTRLPGESRRAAMSRGRDAVRTLRHVRAEAIAADALVAATGSRARGHDVALVELAARGRVRLLTVGALAALILVGLVVATHLAGQIGVDLTPSRQFDDVGWLAGQLDRLGGWWDQRGTGEKILIGAGLAALIALSGGSLSLAVGVSGAGVYVADHANGTAALVRDPQAAVGSWLATTSPADAALDVGEFALTFAPGNFLGAAAGRRIRSFAGHGATDAAHAAPARSWEGWYADPPTGVRATPETRPPGAGAEDLWSRADAMALRDYTGDGYESINLALRSRTVMPGSAMGQRIEALSTALTKLPKHEGVVYRGTWLTPEQTAKYIPGKTVPEDAFTSASQDRSVMRSGNTQFTIVSRTGRDVEAKSLIPWEREVLFDHDTLFYVMSNTVDDATGVTKIYLLEVPR